MPDVASPEAKGISEPSPLLSLEGIKFQDLPPAVKMEGDIVTQFNELRSLQKETNTEHGAFLARKGGQISMDYIMKGHNEGSMGPPALFEDLTGLSESESSQRLSEILKKEEWRKDAPDWAPKYHIFGANLQPMPASDLPKWVAFFPQKECLGIVHTHPQNHMFSGPDFDTLACQIKRPDGRATAILSIVLGSDEIYLQVAPTDADVAFSENWDEEMNNPRRGKTARAAFQVSTRTPKEKFHEAWDTVIIGEAERRRFGLYRGRFEADSNNLVLNRLIPS